jgi:AcrR family transcriptional regulator
MARPPKITRLALQQVALALVDRSGLEALSMRAVAAELGTAPMTLYNYVSDREELLLLVVQAVVAEVKLPTGPFEHWCDEVKAIAHASWMAVRAHPYVIPLILTRRSRSPEVMRQAETLLRALAKSGRRGHDLLCAFRSVTSLVMGLAQAELAGPLALRAQESADDTIARFRSLPRDQFPWLIDIAGAALTSSPESEFHAAMDLLLSGLSQPEA